MAEIIVSAHAKNTTKTEIIMKNHTILIDEPPFFGGVDEAPSPVEMLLASLAGAFNAIGQWVANEMEISINDLKIDITGEVDSKRFKENDPSIRAGFSKINVVINLDSDADEEKKAAWFDAVTYRCPVLDNLCNNTEVNVGLSADITE